MFKVGLLVAAVLALAVAEPAQADVRAGAVQVKVSVKKAAVKVKVKTKRLWRKVKGKALRVKGALRH